MNSLNSSAVIILGLGALFYLVSSSSKKEGFRHIRQQAQPDFDANLSPRSDNIGVQQGGQLGFNQSPSLQMGGVPPTTVSLMANANYNTLGAISSPGDKLLLTRGNFLTNDQVQKIVGSGTPDYQPNQLPTPDMRYSAGLDPTNPQNYIYDRTLFAKLKRRYRNDVDYFRGDIDVTPEYRGWFDIRKPGEVDVVKGYFDRYIDIQQDTAIRDAIFDRNTPDSQKQMRQNNPYGAVDRLANANV